MSGRAGRLPAMPERAPAGQGLLSRCLSWHVPWFVPWPVPWPQEARTAPLNPSREALEAWARGPALPAIRLAWTLYPRTAQEGADWLALAARAGRMLWLADLRAAERNLDVPAVLAAGLLAGSRGRRFLAAGGLEGCVARIGGRVVRRQAFGAGAGLVLGVSLEPSVNQQSSRQKS